MPPPYDWDAVRDTLSELYLVNGLPLKNIIEIMRERYEFTPRFKNIFYYFILRKSANSLQSSGIQR